MANDGKHTGPTRPRLPTVKRLFAVSGNRCAFPRCQTGLIDQATGIVLGEVCHIKGEKPTAARHDKSQTNEERHAFENLILMCGVHHKVIDDDEDSYSLDRLRALKVAHEAANGGGSEPSDKVANQLLNNISIQAVGGSVIVTQYQMGGQVAHQITNVGPQSRKIPRAAVEGLIVGLRDHPKESFELISSNDPESASLKEQIKAAFTQAGWTLEGDLTDLTGSKAAGVVVSVKDGDKFKPQFLAIANWLNNIGLLKSANAYSSGLDRMRIDIGPNPQAFS